MGAAEEFYEELLSAVAFEGDRAVLRITATYQPAGGPGSKVYPPTFPEQDGSRYAFEDRWIDGEQRRAVLLDQTQSQANRAEEALRRGRAERGLPLPLFELRHSGAAEAVLTSLEFPHRYADAYLRDSLLDGTEFDKTELGRAMLSASLADATALYRHDPGSLVFGAWNSHRKGRQDKFPRIYASEVVGWDPVEGTRRAGRMDPLNLVGAAKPQGDGWDYAVAATKTKGEKLSEIGHGNIAPNPAHGGVTVSSASRLATVSLAGLDRIGFGDATLAGARAARALLAAYALVADRLAFARPSLWLRSGCELVLETETVAWVRRGGTTEPVEFPVERAVQVFVMAAERAAAAAQPMSAELMPLTPSAALAKAIDYSLTKAETTGE